MKKFPKIWAYIGLFFVFSSIALAVDTATRLTNAVIIGNGVAGTKTLTFDIGGSNPLIESVAGVLKLSTNGTNLMSVPAATDTLIGKATTDTLSNKTISGTTGLSFAGSSSGTANVIAPAAAGTPTLTLPTTTDTLVGKATTDTLTNKTLSAPAITGAWTATGDLTETKAGSIQWIFNNTSTSGSTVLTLESGNGTTSANNQYIDFLDNDSSQVEWQVGHVGTNDLSFYNATAGSAKATLDSVGDLSISGAINVGTSYGHVTWTPVITAATGSGQSSPCNFARYTRLANIVTADFACTWAKGSGSGNMTITGLPVVPTSDNNYTSYGVLLQNSTATYIMYRVNSGTTTVALEKSSTTNLTAADLGSSVFFAGTIIYRVD